MGSVVDLDLHLLPLALSIPRLIVAPLHASSIVRHLVGRHVWVILVSQRVYGLGLLRRVRISYSDLRIHVKLVVDLVRRLGPPGSFNVHVGVTKQWVLPLPWVALPLKLNLILQVSVVPQNRRIRALRVIFAMILDLRLTVDVDVRHAALDHLGDLILVLT